MHSSSNVDKKNKLKSISTPIKYQDARHQEEKISMKAAELLKRSPLMND